MSVIIQALYLKNSEKTSTKKKGGIEKSREPKMALIQNEFKNKDGVLEFGKKFSLKSVQ